MTVTPPAAAAREAQPSPSWLAWLPECTWPSTTPGMIHCPLASTLSRAAGRAGAARGDPAVPHGQPAVFHDAVRIDDIAAHHPIEIAHDPFHPMKN